MGVAWIGKTISQGHQLEGGLPAYSIFPVNHLEEVETGDKDTPGTVK
jgi:hypothetical protein